MAYVLGAVFMAVDGLSRNCEWVAVTLGIHGPGWHLCRRRSIGCDARLWAGLQ
jgi:hypothetical protein